MQHVFVHYWPLLKGKQRCVSHVLQGARKGHEDLLKVHVIIRDLLKKVRSYPPESLGNTIVGGASRNSN